VNNGATGFDALFSNKTGSDDEGVGVDALEHATGSSNTALGASAGVNLTTGANDVDIASPGVDGESKTISIGAAAHSRPRTWPGSSGSLRRGRSGRSSSTRVAGWAPPLSLKPRPHRRSPAPPGCRPRSIASPAGCGARRPGWLHRPHGCETRGGA
jgi:hypothetical protein